MVHFTVEQAVVACVARAWLKIIGERILAAASRSACISVCLPYLVTTNVPGSVGMTTFVYAPCLHTLTFQFIDMAAF
jgi:hypothetical protein